MFDTLWITHVLPVWLLQRLGALSLVAVGLLVEKHYVGRTTTFANTVAINIHAAFAAAPLWLVRYANIGLIVGLIALASYASRESLPGWFYLISLVYSSAVVGLLILVT
ncbi:hypothetical protein [Geoglobus acetivorans]|uniref:Uncharacterized protein n=1 Tax=Geoglobus acetivorans TaxID=565033 RepID=A0ABZ3H0M9_GEOAI|nr:hypothetical protein [Geoglobus acetivorans]